MNLFVTLIYQPFLNLLVLFYWLLDQIPNVKPDMGVAVILLSIVIRIVLLPVTLASDRSEKERREIAEKSKKIQSEYATDPVRLNEELKKLFRSNPRIVVAEVVDFGISVLITFLLIRIFAEGIKGADLHLLYRWMPNVDQPYNLIFWGKYDLGRPNFVLNLVQSLVILVVEIIAEFSSPFHNILPKEAKPIPTNSISPIRDNYVSATRSRVRSLQFTLPIVSFLIFMFLPAGKKLFIITTLIFSMMLMLIKMFVRKWRQWIPESAPEIVAEVIPPSHSPPAH